MKTVLFAGGDKRTLHAIEYMKKQGFDVKTYAIEDRAPIDGRAVSAAVLPFPCLKQGKLNAPLIPDSPTLTEFLAETGIDPMIPVIGGPIPENPFPNYTDLSLREDLKLRNAVTTVEGAVNLLIQHTDRAIFGTRCLVIGYGAIGKRLSAVLSLFGGIVTVAARKTKDRTDAELHGYGTVDTKALQLQGFYAIFNTVPQILLTESVLETADPSAVIFELASAPGGIDRNGAERLHRKVVDGPALPGKVAPVTAGEDLAKTVIDILQTTP